MHRSQQTNVFDKKIARPIFPYLHQWKACLLTWKLPVFCQLCGYLYESDCATEIIKQSVRVRVTHTIVIHLGRIVNREVQNLHQQTQHAQHKHIKQSQEV